MKTISYTVFVLLFPSILIVDQTPPTQPFPGIACITSEIQLAGDGAVNDIAKTTPNAASFVSGVSGISSIADPNTGLSSGIYYPFSLLNKNGHIVAQGSVILDAKCSPIGGFSSTDVHTKQVH